MKCSIEKRVLALAALLLGGVVQAQGTAALPFETAPAVMQETPLERLYDGTVEAVNQATLSAQTAGRIAEVFYDVDDYVEANSPIVRFTNVEQQTALQQAQAALQEALARQVQATEDFRRIEGLYSAGTVSKREYDQALASRDATAARVASGRSAVKAAEQQVEYTLVRAPYAGIVTQRHIEIGETVSVGQPLMSGLSLEALRVSVHLPQQMATQVRDNRIATVITDVGPVTPTHITVFPFADEASNTLRVRLELPQGQFALYPGMFVKVAFVVGKSRRLLIPAAAVLHRSEVTAVYVLGAEGQVRLRQLRVGSRFGDQTEVLAGLHEGERVAVDPLAAGIYAKSMAGRK